MSKVESEGSWRESSDQGNTNIKRHTQWDEFAKQNEVQNLQGLWSLNDEGRWNEGYWEKQRILYR